jgi:glycosyltransferase involved in cell wall biosynthesis
VEMNSEKRHILIVANTTWNIYNFRLNVIRRLLESGYRLSVLAPVDEYIRYTECFPEVDHINLHYLDRDSTNPISDLRLLAELWGVYRKLRPDLILHYTVKPNIYGGLAARLVGIPSVAVVTGLGYPFIHEGLARKMTGLLYRLSNRFHRKVIFENRDDLQFFIEERLVDGSKGISIKGCGVDTNYYYPQEPARTNGRVTFTFIGRLLYDKGIREFVEAAHLVRKTHAHVQFWLIGQIDEENPSSISKSDLVDWVKDPAIEYLGSKEDVRPYIAKSDCVVLPSYREAIARSLTEAMAMGKPVIGTDTAGVREAIDDHQNGFLVGVRDVDSLAGAMEKFIAMSRKERQEMGMKGRRKVLEEFDDRRIAEQIVEISQRVLDDRR